MEAVETAAVEADLSTAAVQPSPTELRTLDLRTCSVSAPRGSHDAYYDHYK